MLMFLLIVAVWSLGAALVSGQVSGSLVATLILAEGLIVVQGLTGVILLLLGARAGQWEHWMYGVVAALSLPAAYGATRNHPGRPRLVLIAVTCLWVAALSVRGFATGV